MTENKIENKTTPVTDGKGQNVVFKNCFNKGFWQSAFGEVKSLKSLVICALFVALRVAVKSLKLPIAPPYVYFSFDFLVNSLGAMVYGPVLGLLGGAVSDTIGALLFPTGTYFFPFIFVEMASAFIFGLVLYKQELTTMRVLLARFLVVFICNLVLNPIIMQWYYNYIGSGKAYEFFNITRLIKNVALLPAESIVLVLFLRAVAVPLARLGLVTKNNEKLKITHESILLLIGMTVVACVFIALYVCYKQGYITI